MLTHKNVLTVPEVSCYSRQEIEGGVIIRYLVRSPGETAWRPVKVFRPTEPATCVITVEEEERKDDEEDEDGVSASIERRLILPVDVSLGLSQNDSSGNNPVRHKFSLRGLRAGMVIPERWRWIRRGRRWGHDH